MSARAQAVLHERSEQAGARRRRAGGGVGTAGRRVGGRVQRAGWLSGPRRSGSSLSGGGTSPGGLGAAAAQALAPPGRPGMGVAGRTGRHRAGRVQRAADRGHPGGRSSQRRDHHRSRPAGHHHRRRDRRRSPPQPPGPARRRRGNRRIRGGPARRHHRTDLERSRTALVSRGARRCRGLHAAGHAGAAPARRFRRHGLRLWHGRPDVAGGRVRGPLCGRPADPAHTHRDPAGRARLPHDRGHRRGVHRLVRGHRTPRGGSHRTVQRADPRDVTGRRHAGRHWHHHSASIARSPRRSGRRDHRPRPRSAGAGHRLRDPGPASPAFARPYRNMHGLQGLLHDSGQVVPD